MSTRRKYRTRAEPDMAAEPAPASPAASDAPSDPSPGLEDNPLQRALDAQQHAEELQHQHHAAHQAHHAAVDALGLNPHKTAMLKQHPDMLKHGHAIRQHYENALAAGVADDSPEMDQHLVRAMHHEIAKHGGAPPQQMHQGGTPQMHEDSGADDLEREAAEHHAAWMAANPPPPPPAKRKSIPMSAPVSRDIAGMSGHRADSSKTHLSADERQIARVSFPHLSKEQAEWQYVQNKKKMLAKKASGEIQA